jgi:hypothetical protein
MKAPQNCLLRDAPRRRALLKFLKGVLPGDKPLHDSRIGLLMGQSWLNGYEVGLRRGLRRADNGGAPRG